MVMKLSIVILCWNDRKVILDAIRSIYETAGALEFEVIVSDNGSTDDSIERIQRDFPHPNLRIVWNRANLGFSRGNNAGIAAAQGQYVLILNPDTIVHPDALQKLVDFADRHPEAGAFGCRVLNPDGTYQKTAMVFPTVGKLWIHVFGLHRLGRYWRPFLSRTYVGWDGDTEREIDWHSGCCVMVRGDLLRQLGGFDPQFFYHCEEVDLCYRVRQAGHRILFTPQARITHLGGQSVKRAPVRFALETHRSFYRYFYKHYGATGVKRIRYPVLLLLARKWLQTAVLHGLRPSEISREALRSLRIEVRWNYLLDPVRFAVSGDEPRLGFEPMAPAAQPAGAPK
jgi:GT2 family glycosyltransferase